MKKSMLVHIAVLVSVIVTGGLLISVSQSVRRAERDTVRLDLAIEQEKEALRVLKAEWSMLNSPDRIEALAKKYLGWDLPEASHLVSDPKNIEPAQDEQGGFMPAALGGEEVSGTPMVIPRKPAPPAYNSASNAAREESE